MRSAFIGPFLRCVKEFHESWRIPWASSKCDTSVLSFVKLIENEGVSRKSEIRTLLRILRVTCRWLYFGDCYIYNRGDELHLSWMQLSINDGTNLHAELLSYLLHYEFINQQLKIRALLKKLWAKFSIPNYFNLIVIRWISISTSWLTYLIVYVFDGVFFFPKWKSNEAGHQRFQTGTLLKKFWTMFIMYKLIKLKPNWTCYSMNLDSESISNL